MNRLPEKLFLELRQSQLEIKKSLKTKQSRDWLTVILEEELEDINAALKKLKDGNFGQCEISGEFLPHDLLQMIPTIRTVKDSNGVGKYYKKTINTSFC